MRISWVKKIHYMDSAHTQLKGHEMCFFISQVNRLLWSRGDLVEHNFINAPKIKTIKYFYHTPLCTLWHMAIILVSEGAACHKERDSLSLVKIRVTWILLNLVAWRLGLVIFNFVFYFIYWFEKHRVHACSQIVEQHIELIINLKISNRTNENIHLCTRIKSKWCCNIIWLLNKCKIVVAQVNLPKQTKKYILKIIVNR